MMITNPLSTTTEALTSRLVTTAELSLILGVSRRTIVRMRTTREIPAIHVRGHLWRYDIAEVLDALRRHS